MAKMMGIVLKLIKYSVLCILPMKPHIIQLQDQQWKIWLEHMFGCRHSNQVMCLF